ncbi:hypothetical protein [Hymenobacter edaphi]|uniref:hypothetical protein n=1 Tax=Hymenobacter edaphi TaxID=2211146 RepID=UPI00105826A6|nr:hypothetical protein [Hymenobacter edaphi]
MQIASEFIPRDLYAHIDLIRQRPAMYLGRLSLTALYHYIEGYLSACYNHGVEEELTPDFGEFHRFVAAYYLHGETTAGWCKVLLAEHYGCEESALHSFFELFDQFRQGAKPANTKQILFALLERMLQVNTVDINAHNPFEQRQIKQALIYLQKLPAQIVRAKYLFVYEGILEELEAYAATNDAFRNILDDVKAKCES